MNERRKRLCFLSSIIILAAATFELTGWAQSVVTRQDQEQSVRPDINAHFLDPELNPEEWVGRFEVESREIFRSRMAVVEAVGLQKGDRVADIGAGTGLFTMLFADEVGLRGWVFAIEIAPRFVERIGELADQRGLAHVTPLLGAKNLVRLPADSVDVAFVCDTYHHFEFPHSMLASIKRALRPGGRLIIVDFQRIPGVSREWIMDHVRAGKPEVCEEVEAAKFEFLGETSIEGLQENYFMTFRNPTE